MTTGTKKKIIIGCVAIVMIGGIFGEKPPEEVKKDEVKVAIKKEVTAKTKELFTLGDYKESSKEIKLAYIKKMFQANKWSKENERKYLTPYYDCMGDFAYQKDTSLTFLEVVKWCDNERAKFTIKFYSHINELDVRNSGNYKIVFDENIALLKEQKKEEAKRIAIELQKKSITSENKEFPKHQTPAQALEELGGLYTVKEISKNEVILYISYYAGDNEEWFLEEAKRSFIDGVFQAFIYTDVDFIKIGVLIQENETKKQHILSFQGSIRREDALKITQSLLHINKFDDLITVKKADTFVYAIYNSIANRARYNDQGTPTLNIFFDELSKVTY